MAEVYSRDELLLELAEDLARLQGQIKKVVEFPLNEGDRVRFRPHMREVGRDTEVVWVVEGWTAQGLLRLADYPYEVHPSHLIKVAGIEAAS